MRDDNMGAATALLASWTGYDVGAATALLFMTPGGHCVPCAK